MTRSADHLRTSEVGAELPKYVHVKRAKGRTYYYYDTGKANSRGRRIRTRLPSPDAGNFQQALARAELSRRTCESRPDRPIIRKSEPKFGEFDPATLEGGDRPTQGDDLYFIRAGNFVKIGRAADVWKRMTNMQANNPVELDCIGHLRGRGHEERAWQAYFRDFWIRGEWFEWSLHLADAIADAREGKQWWREAMRP